MIIRLENYHSFPRIVSYADDDSVEQELQRSNLPYFSVLGNSVVFCPDGYTAMQPQKVLEKIAQCNSFDVFDLAPDGTAYQCFDSLSGENGFMLTGKCNSNCIMCPAPDRQRKKDGPSTQKILEIIRHIPNDIEHITITGGEPFLIGQDIFQILSTMRNHFCGTQFQLLTNGRALSYKPFLEQFCESAPSNIIVGIPLHGSSAELHDRITRSPGGFMQTIHGIQNLLSRNFSVELRLVISQLNRNDISEIAKMITLYFPNVTRVVLMGLEMLGNAAANKNQVWLSYHEAFLASKQAIDILAQNGITVWLYNFPLCAVDEPYRLIVQKSISENKVRFPELCDTCDIKDACGGFFLSSLRYAENDIKPVKKC